MSAAAMTMQDEVEEGFEPYRAVSKAAVGSLILGVVSFLGLLTPVGLVFSLAAVGLGWLGLRTIRNYPQELTGRPFALVGLVLAIVTFVSGSSWHGYEYATEVPDGYRRITFNELQPMTQHPELPVSPDAVKLNGQRVFVKGYIHPGDPGGQKSNLKKFILVPDMGTCCFGGQPKLTHMIEVTLADPHRIAYSLSKRKLAGTLRVDTQLKPVSGVGGVFFQLDADFVK